MVVTSEVDTSSLLDHFDLGPYDNFLPPEVYDQEYKMAREAVRERKVRSEAGWGCMSRNTKWPVRQ